MSDGTAPLEWYPDPARGYQRYYDGSAWTAHTAPLPPPIRSGPPWKGARYGRPQFGPGAVADPWRRLGRTGLYALASCLSWLGFIDYLWCLWDDDAQCLHDKAAKTLVVRD